MQIISKDLQFQKKNWIEVGSGLGQEAEYMSQKGCSVLGIDLSQEMTNYAWIHRKCGLYLTLDFFKVYDLVGGNHFDGLWASSSVLTHINKKNAPKFFLEARKLLKISGYMGIIVRKDKFNFKSKVVFNNYSKDEISHLMIEDGFEILHISEKKFKDSKWWFVLSKRIS